MSEVLTVPYAAPLDFTGLLGWYRARSLDGVETVGVDSYQVAVQLPHGTRALTLRDDPTNAQIIVESSGIDRSDDHAVANVVQRMFDLDADPTVIDTHLEALSVFAPLVHAVPGIRIAGTATPLEALLRAVTGQQVTVASGRAQLERMVSAVRGAQAADTHAADTQAGAGELRPFPAAAEILDADLAWYRGPAGRRDTLREVLRFAADGGLDPANEADEVAPELLALRGIGPWTVAYTMLRGYRAPDVDLSGDRALMVALERLGLESRSLSAVLASAAPWRSYGALHLWRVHSDSQLHVGHEHEG